MFNRSISREEAQRIKQEYPKGTKVRLIHMDDTQAPDPGTEGEVMYVDDIGSIHVRWKTGSGLALIPGVDAFEKISE